jgi:hypothetical protein
MELKHLTDKELQDILEKNPVKNEKEILAHLEICGECHQKLRQYELIFGNLGMVTIPELPPTFARSVTNRIREEELESLQIRKPVNLKSILLSFASVICGLTLIFYFVDLSVFINAFQLPGFEKQMDMEYLTKSRELISGLKIDFGLIGLVGLALIVTAVLDYMIRYFRRKTASFLI